VNGRLDEHFFGPARTAYGTDVWDEAYAAGAEMDFEPAVMFALTPERRARPA
jgi:hypothetical protein